MHLIKNSERSHAARVTKNTFSCANGRTNGRLFMSGPIDAWEIVKKMEVERGYTLGLHSFSQPT